MLNLRLLDGLLLLDLLESVEQVEVVRRIGWGNFESERALTTIVSLIYAQSIRIPIDIVSLQVFLNDLRSLGLVGCRLLLHDLELVVVLLKLDLIFSYFFQ